MTGLLHVMWSSTFWKSKLHCLLFTCCLTGWTWLCFGGRLWEQWFHFRHCMILDNHDKYGEVCVFWSLMIKFWTWLSAVSPFHYYAPWHLLQLQQYQYYSAGLLSTHDPYYEQQRHLLGPKKRKFKEEKKIKGKVTNLVFLNACCD